MRYADYYDCDICNGNAVGMSLFVQGCPLHCDGCFNPETWSFTGGREWNEGAEKQFLELAGRDYISRISILGGSPLCEENTIGVLNLVSKLRYMYPEKQIWIYTGYTWESIYKPDFHSFSGNTIEENRMNVLRLIDVIVDGPFDYDKKDLSLPFRGSWNQRIIDVQKSLINNEMTLWELGE